jgi:hypothetical protein
VQDNPVVFSDGTPAAMIPLPPDSQYPGMQFRTNSASTNGASPNINPQHELMLHHYMSRSLEDFVNRKLIRKVGTQSRGYASAPGEDPWDPAVMRRHEEIVGMIGDAEVCKAVAAGTIVERCCSSGE